MFLYGWGTVIRTQECRSQSPMPYHLAIAQCSFYFIILIFIYQEYLIFLEKKINHLSFYNTNAKDTYQVMPTLITPIFGYEDRENVIIDIPQGTSTYVQYSLVRENEFFVTSKQALTTLIEMKHRFLNTYSKEN